MRFDIITIFPEIFESYFNASIIKRAQEKKIVTIKVRTIRRFGEGKHKQVDDRPYGGGAGMVLMAEPVVRTVSAISLKLDPRLNRRPNSKFVVLSAKGKQFTQKMAHEWARKYKRIILISGRYEGIDERVKTILKADEISIGPYVTTDGDVAAMVIVSAVTRLLPGVIKLESLQEESHWNWLKKEEGGGRLLEYPHYTRPEVLKWNGRTYRVPKVLLSGDHKRIEAWRKKHIKRAKFP